jgi:DNA-binding MarR family transcriptional regulator
MAELQIINQNRKSSSTVGHKGVAAMTTQLVAGLEKIGLAMKSRTWRRQGRAGLGPLQKQVLSLLRSKAGQSVQISTVANELAVRMPTASEAVATLERKHLVRRRRTNQDGRVVTVHLTAKGTRASSPSPGMPERLATATDALSLPERVSLLTTLTKLIRTLQEEGEITVAQMCVSCEYFRPHQHEDAARPHHCAFINAPFGEQALRLDCSDYKPASVPQAKDAWISFVGARTS